jgi:hypothetical protein
MSLIYSFVKTDFKAKKVWLARKNNKKDALKGVFLLLY